MPRAKTALPSPAEGMLLILMLLLPLLFIGPSREPFELPKLALLEAGVLAAAVWVVARGARRLDLDPIAIALLAFLASAALSTLRSPNPLMSAYGATLSWAGLATAIGTAGVFFVARGAVRTVAAWKRLAACVSIAAGAAAAYALLQALGLDPIQWSRMATFGGAERVFGTLGHPNLLGAYLAMALPLIVWLGLRVRGGGRGILLGVAAALATAGIVATLSRAAWGGLLAAALVGTGLGARARAEATDAGFRPTRAFLLSALAGLIVVASLYAAAGIFRAPLSTRVVQVTDLSAPTTQSRLELWHAGLRMFADHPVAGAGLDTYGLFFPAYRTAAYWRLEWLADPRKAHSEPIQILATQGILGGIAAAAVALLIAGSLWRMTRRGPPALRTAAAAAGASLAAFAVTDVTGFTVVATGTLAAALAGAVSGMEREPRREASVRPNLRTLFPLAAAALGIVLAVSVPPLLADRARVEALAYPLGSPERIRSYLRAERRSPWTPGDSYELARSYLEAAGAAGSRSERAELLRLGEAASRRAIVHSPFDGAAHLERARILAAALPAGPHPEEQLPVREELRRAVELDPQNGIVLLGSAKLWLELDRPDESRALALQAARLYPDYASPLAFVGFLALRDRRYQDGIDTLSLAVKRQFRGESAAEAIAWNNLAYGYLVLDRPVEAYAAAARALAADPSLANARQNRAEAERRLRAASKR